MLRLFIMFNFLVALCAFAKEKKPPVFSYPKELETAMDAAREAGSILLQYWNKEADLEIEMKETTPVTIADFQSNEAICKKLLADFPDYGLLTEEKIGGEPMEKAIARWREAEWTWMVDPLDGTKSFIAGRKDFGIHIALLHFGVPILGVNYYPVSKTMYLAVEGCGAYKQVRKKPLQQIHAEAKAKAVRPVVSSKKSSFVRSFYTALLGMPLTPKMLRKDFKNVGSCGLRLCMIAEGKRNIYASSGESGSVWDYASGAVILQEAGGFISDLEGKPLDFLSDTYKFKSGTLSCGSKELFEKAIRVSEIQDH
jgi:3'(2'), 5'-bisphosphate nucleotidase